MTQTLYKNFKLFDGNKFKIQENAWFVVDNESGKITKLGFNESPDMENAVDLKNKYVMPGLVNAHTHIMMNPQTNKLNYLSEAEVTFTALKNLKELLKSGVTYVRDCGCAFDVDIKLRRLQDEGQLGGTEIMPSGRPMSMTGGHGDFTEGLDGETTWGNLVDSQDEMRKAVRREFKLGAKNIKVMATGGVMSATDQIDDTELTEEEIATAVEEAHSKHMTVAAHAEGANGIHNAVVAGVDSIEHASYITDEDIEQVLKKGIYVSPTLIAAYTIPEYGEGKLPQYMLDKANAFIKDFYERIGACVKAGVKLTLGTDAGTPFNDFKDTAKELELLTTVGATNEQALSASINSSKLMGIDDEYGTLEVGKMADFLVLDDDPVEDVKAVQQVDKMVYKKGVKAF
ncbi:metal-dependent hydrolase family protein [Companilactobacillus pabuli]|jgi:imidazolonepropionase-like amidohydrolase|uniref:Amidohydrolase family protein n=1 Tax=Companilactobacillus pabuli TaxID=2714036 RepID=A0A7L7KX64_9LACO|nr:amidohydrolase family protein [Companilactobacillus pabuli]AKP03620.1 amidohydrolase [Companilactobacillus farciminis]AKS51925.1 amidohydrolase [Companilactobacillus farciminis]MDG5112827.1 amidohydrolase family protein [Companilactobacillus pabuli]QMT84397.1 amidohydrolase family protein [Companilactobacillus pabuli]GAQ00471.1 amidohydrolase [Companilactobacillus farciminis]